MNLDKFTGSGSTPSRRAFWDQVADAVLSSQKREGRNASVDEHEGQGTVINFPDQTPSAPVTGACCVGEVCSITTEADCEGEWQGGGSVCDPNPCIPSGACCIDDVCSILSEESCNDSGGIYQGDDTTCDPTPCLTGACCHGIGGHTCSIESEIDCGDIGGTYYGNGSLCDPSPCVGVCCSCFGCETGFTEEDCAARPFSVFFVGETDCDTVGCPSGRCCYYDAITHAFEFCALTTETQCNTECCDPACPDLVSVWTEGVSSCAACPPF